MLVLSVCGSIASAFALYTFVDGKAVEISAAAFALAAATLGIAGVHMVREIDQPSTPTASLGMRIYILSFAVATTGIAVAVARDVFMSVQPAALSVVGLVSAVLAFDVGFIAFCAWIVQIKRARDAKA